MNPHSPEDQLRHPEGRIYAALEKIGDLTRAMQWESAKLLGLSPLQVQVLLFLQGHPENMRKGSLLADEFAVSRPTVSDALKSLEKKGLLSRKKDTVDTRSYLLELTPAGESTCRQLQAYPQPLLTQIAAMDEERQGLLLSNLLNLIEQMHQLGLVKTARMCFACANYQGDKLSDHYCKLLQRPLENEGLRTDCPEFEAPGA